MENVVLTVHLILALLLIGVVLLQRSEGGGLGLGGGGGGVMTGRQAANALTPAAAATELVATGTFRAWRGFIQAYQGRFEHDEIRELAAAVLDVMAVEAPLLFGDLRAEQRR
mgnify:CR=1 FL=1